MIQFLPHPVSALLFGGEAQPAAVHENVLVVVKQPTTRFLLESLILAQDERWRRA